MDHFELVSEYKPTGDQPQAIKELVEGFKEGNQCQTLLGVTGSGKTFTMANVIQQLNKPTLIIAHNKTLAAQLYGEFKEFFPDNAVEYFVSYYDYYQPEAYVPSSDTYIAKDSSVNEEIDKLRLSATAALIERRDVIVIASVSCIYGLGEPENFEQDVYKRQQESYCDKHQAASHGLYQANVDDLHEDYICPQENGSHYDCEYVELNNSRYGIVVSAENAFSFNASYYTQEELEKKTHNYEPVSYTHLDVYKRQLLQSRR